MKFKNILSLSIKNIFLKKFAYLKVVAGFFFAFLVIFIVLFYSGSLSTAYDDYRDVKADDLIYNIHGALSDEEEKEIRAFPQVKSIHSYSELGLYKNEKQIIIGGYGYTIDDNESVYGRFIGYNSDYFYSENAALAFTADKGEELLLFGETLQNENDMLISEKLLISLDITERESLIGKELSISGFKYGDEWIDDERELLPFSKSGTICGIINGHYKYDDYICFEDEETHATETEISLNTFIGNEDFFKRMEELFEGKYSHYFEGNSQLSRMKTVEGQQMLCNRFLSLICVVLLTVICVYVASNQYYLLQKNSTFYGILKANGVDNKSVFLTHMFELAITLSVALIIAFAFGIGVFFIMKKLFYSFLYIDLYFPAGIAVGSFFGFLALCLGLAVLITLFIYNKILKKQPVHLLKK